MLRVEPVERHRGEWGKTRGSLVVFIPFWRLLSYWEVVNKLGYGASTNFDLIETSTLTSTQPPAFATTSSHSLVNITVKHMHNPSPAKCRKCVKMWFLVVPDLGPSRNFLWFCVCQVLIRTTWSSSGCLISSMKPIRLETEANLSVIPAFRLWYVGHTITVILLYNPWVCASLFLALFHHILKLMACEQKDPLERSMNKDCNDATLYGLISSRRSRSSNILYW